MTPERIKELLDPANDYRALRIAAGKIVKPGPWRHKWGSIDCTKCHCSRYDDGQDDGYVPNQCAVPDIAEGPLEVIAAKLVKMCDESKLEFMIHVRYEDLNPDTRDRTSGRAWCWFAYTGSAEQIGCCLQALEGW